MVLTNRWDRVRYRLYAPVYDWVAQPLERGRQRAIERLDPGPDEHLLLLGCGTGLDLGYLPERTTVTAIDLTPAMVHHTAKRAKRNDRRAHPVIGDAAVLPFADDVFDGVLVHLILSVVPDPQMVMREASRVLAPDGNISIFDKFRPVDGPPSLVRRIGNPVARLLFADLNRDLDAIVSASTLEIGDREPFIGGLYTVTTAHPTAAE